MRSSAELTGSPPWPTLWRHFKKRPPPQDFHEKIRHNKLVWLLVFVPVVLNDASEGAKTVPQSAAWVTATLAYLPAPPRSARTAAARKTPEIDRILS